MSNNMQMPRCFANWRPFFNQPFAKLITLLIIGMAGWAVGIAQAGDVKLAWDPVADSRVAGYQVAYGSASGQYANQVATASTAATVTGLTPGNTYYFAVAACAANGTCSAFSNEVSTTVPSASAAPVAGFVANTVLGTAPVTVSFTDQSTGSITGWTWSFGDGTGATVQSPQHSYTAAGTYSVSLTVTGPGGTNSATRTGYVQVLPPPPVAAFAASVRSGFAPLLVTFTDQSSGQVTGRTWTFGDGGTSTAATAVYTYKVPGTYTVSLQVSGPGGANTAVQSAFITVQGTAPVANFTGNVLKGPAPLTVTFQNSSTGQFSTSTWTFGDGTTSSQTAPTHTYTKPGQYTVTLVVSGAGGTNTLTRSAYVQVPVEVPMEIGEVLVNQVWQRITYKTPFTNPIVVAKPLSSNDAARAEVRIKGIDATGFWIRVQEWPYLDGIHAYETASYMVMESGRYQLPSGAWVEAGRLQTPTYNNWTTRTFSKSFSRIPVVLTSVTSVNEADTVVTRLRSATVKGFQVLMQEQQSSNQQHRSESIDYIACEPTFGMVNGMHYAVGLMSQAVSSTVYTLVYPIALTQAPRFLADMQTTNDADIANLRWRNRNEAAVDVWASEEQSRDSEVVHGKETIGYFVADQAQ